METPQKRVLFVVFILFCIFFSFRFISLQELLFSIGFLPAKIKVAATGSMYPTFPKSNEKHSEAKIKENALWVNMKKFPSGFEIFGKRFFSRPLRRGDIVQFENEKTKQLSLQKYKEEAGFVKRIIGLPGDTLELRDGFVYLNETLLDEPYTAKPRSTFGGQTLWECQKLVVPPGYFFVMGDNRKASLDSRFELGLVEEKDIHYVLPWEEQGEYRNLWRESKNDFLLAKTPTLNVEKFIEILNQKRKEENLKPYKLHSLLSFSSLLRGKKMLATNDFSSEATRSGFNFEKAIKQSGYRNIIYAEVFVRGYYDEEELLENFWEFPNIRKILFSSEYQDIGLAAVLGEVENCPIQVIVVHFGGYVPPNYSQEEIKSWKNLVTTLEEVLPFWRELRKARDINQNKVERLLYLLETRLAYAKKILSKMESKQWLTEEEKKIVNEDKSVAEEAERIIMELNQ